MRKDAIGAVQEEKQTLLAFISQLPKTEIHLHIEGLVSVDSIWALIQKHKLELGIKSKDALRKKFHVTSLTEFIDLFINIVQACFLDVDDLDYLISDTRTYLKRNNIRYAEIFFAPTKLIKNGLPFKEMIAKLHHGAEILKKDGLEIKYIVDVSRGFGLENAMRNLDLTLEHHVPSVIGLGLGGAEQTGPAHEYKPVFDKAIKNGLKVVAHAGEDVGPKSIWESIDLLHVSRIGHGIAAIKDPRLMDTLRDRQIPLEICPTSNLFTRKFATSFENHPVRAFFDHGMYITVNTDDPTLFGVDLNDEYMNLIEHKIFSLDEVIELVKNGIYATFLPEERKNALWASVRQKIDMSSFKPKSS